MEVEQIHCTECNHTVRLVRTADHRDGQANLPPGAELVCLDFGQGCTGRRCPMTGTLGIVMGVRLARSHLREQPWREVTAACGGCGEVAALEVLDGTHAVCPLCGTTNRVVMLEAGPEVRVAVTRK